MTSERDPDSANDPLVSPREEESASGEGPLAYLAGPGGEPASAHETESSSSAVTGPREAGSAETPPVAEERARAHGESTNMLPQRERRRSALETLVVRLIATAGIVGIGVAIAAIMVSSKSQGWIVGLVVSIVSVILAALLWSSRML